MAAAAPDLPSRIASRAEVERLLAAATNYEQVLPDGPQAFDLGRMEALLASQGFPERGPRTLHVAGSKGKGSTARMLAAGLAAASRGPVGLYTSPHLSDLTERIAVDGRPVAESDLERALDALLPHVRRCRGTPLAPTFFELLTAAAWLVFRDQGCTDVVLETGLGGRLDATTVCRPSGTAITTIEREHTRLLGDTVEQIAAEKAGILKRGVPCVTGVSGPALAVIQARARALDVPLEVLGRDVLLEQVRCGPGPRTHVRLRHGAQEATLELPVAGEHQARNAALAYAVLRRLDVPPEAIARGLRSLRLPASLEPFPGRPLVVLDGAHTVESARAARVALAAAWPGRRHTLLLALMAEKDVEAIVGLLAQGALAVVTTAVLSPRALPAAALAERVRAHGPVPVLALEPPLEALEEALRRTPPDALLLVTGSLYLAGALRPHLLSARPGASAHGLQDA